VLVTLVQDAPSEADARTTIIDISRSVYAALEPVDPPTYLGLPPRIARQVFATPDAQGRLALLGDPRTETSALPSEVEVTADAQSGMRLRPEAIGDLVALQRAAAHAGAPIWVSSAFRQPTDAEASKTVPVEWIVPCAVDQPERVADRAVAQADVASAEAQQAWLGTVVTISDRNAGGPTTADDGTTHTGRWLASHAAQYGFVPALAQTAVGHEPWSWRWLGRSLAQRLAPIVGDTTYSARALEQLQRAQADLAALDPMAGAPPLWGLADSCWTIATSSGRGCPSRWYFLPIPFP
jgi:hypothetical protein